MSVVVRPATADDARCLATRLLPEDAAEVRAASGMSIEQNLLVGIERSIECNVMCPEGGAPFAIAGIQPTPEPLVGAIWLLCGEGLHEHRAAFLRESRRHFERYSRMYPVLWNIVDERNTAHIRFLKWHGCVFIHRHPALGHERRPFLEFVRLSCVTP